MPGRSPCQFAILGLGISLTAIIGRPDRFGLQTGALRLAPLRNGSAGLIGSNLNHSVDRLIYGREGNIAADAVRYVPVIQ